MADEHSSTTTAAGESSEVTVDIRIKTLDSQLYDFRVDKNMLVSTFKEKIAGDVGLPVGQQRLIFRGRVLRDQHRLSEYHVESGHTLHLVARQPPASQPSSGPSTGTTTANGQDASAPRSLSRITRVLHSVILGPFSGGDPNLGGPHDISRVLSSVFDSFGFGDTSVPMPPPNMQAAQGNAGRANVNSQSQPENPNQPTPQGMQIPFGTGVAISTLATPIPDSLHTLLVFMHRMEQALSHNGYQLNQPSNDAERSPTIELPSSARGVPLPAALAVVMRHAQRLLSGPVISALSHTAGRLEEEQSCTDPTVRAQIQSEAMQSGLAMQHLGTLLLELGRTMLTLRVRQSPAESSVRAGPAVYISPSGPNPIMVQPFPLQTRSLFGGNATPINSMGFGPVGIGAGPRHINVHIHAGIDQRGTANEELANGAAMTGVNLQNRRADDNTRSENQVSAGQPEGAVFRTEGQKDTKGTENTTLSNTVTKSTNDVEGASSSSTSMDPAAIMNQVFESPAPGDLLSEVSNENGIGSPDVLRSILGQLTQDPAMMNSVSQIAQQIGSDQDFSNMFASMGGPRGGGDDGGGFDLSGMIQLTMPIVAQAFGGGSSSSVSNTSQQTPTMDRELQPQVNVDDLVGNIEHNESPGEVFSSVVEAAAHFDDNVGNADELSEICSVDGLANEFMDMLKRDVSRRMEEEGE